MLYCIQYTNDVSDSFNALHKDYKISLAPIGFDYIFTIHIPNLSFSINSLKKNGDINDLSTMIAN